MLFNYLYFVLFNLQNICFKLIITFLEEQKDGEAVIVDSK